MSKLTDFDRLKTTAALLLLLLRLPLAACSAILQTISATITSLAAVFMGPLKPLSSYNKADRCAKAA